ncbi:MAG: chemotaxis protein methyltransferase [Micavibrio sp.]|nr:MAG: chemotaxis protein methyltransferase [Micavibrio sp.]
MRITDFDIYRDLLKERSGLVLTQDKAYLVESRLGPVAKKWEFASLEAMTGALQAVPDKNLVNDIIEAMTTNETSFFRDIKPFDLFRDTVLPYMLKNRVNQRKIKIWCAAASSGQEPYSLAMVTKEQGSVFSGWDISIKATDISSDILDQARNGVYSQFEVQRGLPITMLMKHFTQDDEKWRLNDDIRKMIQFEYFNLLDSMAALGTFDIIFCRNVLIYFDEETKAQIFEKMSKIIAPDGFLFLGGAETVLGITDTFKPVKEKRGLYVTKDNQFDAEPGTEQAAKSTQAIAQ